MVEEERQKRALWVEEQRQRRERTVDRRVLPVEEERQSPESTVAQSPTIPKPKALFPGPQARQKPGTQDKEIDFDKNIAEDPRKSEVVHIMINGGDPTLWVTVNTHMGTRVGGEYETTTQSTKDIDAFTEHSKPRAMLKSWDTGPPQADIDAYDESWDTGQPPADIDAAQNAGTNTYTHTAGDGRPTHFTHTHVTYTYMQGARSAAGGHVHPLTPAPNKTQIILPSPIPHTRAAERAAFAVLTLTRHIFIDAPCVGTHASTPEADISSAIASVGKGPQENLDRAE